MRAKRELDIQMNVENERSEKGQAGRQAGAIKRF